MESLGKTFPRLFVQVYFAPATVTLANVAALAVDSGSKSSLQAVEQTLPREHSCGQETDSGRQADYHRTYTGSSIPKIRPRTLLVQWRTRSSPQPVVEHGPHT